MPSWFYFVPEEGIKALSQPAMHASISSTVRGTQVSSSMPLLVTTTSSSIRTCTIQTGCHYDHTGLICHISSANLLHLGGSWLRDGTSLCDETDWSQSLWGRQAPLWPSACTVCSQGASGTGGHFEESLPVERQGICLVTARGWPGQLSFDLSLRDQWGGGHFGNKNVGPPGTHPTEVAEALQDLMVKEAGLGWVCQGLVQEVVDKVDSWLHGQHHAWFQMPCCTQAPQTRLINALYTLWSEKRWGNPTEHSKANWDVPVLRGNQTGSAPAPWVLFPDRSVSSSV